MMTVVLAFIATIAAIGLIAWISDRQHAQRLEEHNKRMKQLYRDYGR